MSQVPPAPPTKDDVLAILKAHRDLGPEFDSHLADQIMDLWHHPDTNTRNPSQATAFFQNRASYRESRGGIRRAIPLLALSIPLMGIAGGYAQVDGVMAVLGLDALVMILAAIFG